MLAGSQAGLGGRDVDGAVAPAGPEAGAAAPALVLGSTDGGTTGAGLGGALIALPGGGKTPELDCVGADTAVAGAGMTDCEFVTLSGLPS
jgi:hypothetical protein